MRIVLQGIRAVTVEAVGVVLVVWLLFGCASLGLRSAAGSTSAWDRGFASVLDSFDLASSDPVMSQADAARSEYAAQRLNYYAKLLGTASRNLLGEVLPHQLASSQSSGAAEATGTAWAGPLAMSSDPFPSRVR